METVVLEGKNYRGTFVAEPHTETYRYTDDTGERHHYWWHGQCRIQGPDTDIRANFKTATVRFSYKKLEDALVQFHSLCTSAELRPAVHNKQGLYDLLLERASNDLRQQLESPDVLVPDMNLGTLQIETLPAGLVEKPHWCR